MSPLRILVTGASGRMGRALLRGVIEHPDCALAGALERPGSPDIGTDAGTLAGLPATGLLVTADPLELFVKADAVLDFTAPAATLAFAELAAQARIVHVVGTTGLSEADMEALHAAARHAVVIQSGNFSLGVNVLAALVRRAAELLDPSFDIEIVEMHHRMKVDAPSGTALLLGEAAAKGRGRTLRDLRVPAREGHTGPRVRETIGFAALRGGSVVGDHTVVLAGAGERLELRHLAEDRTLFAQGALKAALWGHGRKPGFFSMADVLGL